MFLIVGFPKHFGIGFSFYYFIRLLVVLMGAADVSAVHPTCPSTQSCSARWVVPHLVLNTHI